MQFEARYFVLLRRFGLNYVLISNEVGSELTSGSSIDMRARRRVDGGNHSRA